MTRVRIGIGHGPFGLFERSGWSGTDLEQSQPQGFYCCCGQLRAHDVLSQMPQQNEGKCVQQPKLVCLEAGTAQPVSVEMELELLNPILEISSVGVEAGFQWTSLKFRVFYRQVSTLQNVRFLLQVSL